MSNRAENRTNHLEKRRAAFLEERARIDKDLALQKRREAAACKHWAVNGFVKQVVLAILKITSGRFEPCALFLERESRRRQWPEKSVHEIMEVVRTVEASFAEDIEGVAPALAQRTAHNYVTQWRVAQWVYSNNVEKGVAMPSCLIVAEFRRLLAEIDVEVSLQAHFVTLGVSFFCDRCGQ